MLNTQLSILPILSHVVFVTVVRGGCCHHACCTDKGSPWALGTVVGPQQCAHQGQVDSGALLLTPHYRASWSPRGAGTSQGTFVKNLPPSFITEGDPTVSHWFGHIQLVAHVSPFSTWGSSPFVVRAHCGWLHVRCTPGTSIHLFVEGMRPESKNQHPLATPTAIPQKHIFLW